jgi:hypothetical protein
VTAFPPFLCTPQLSVPLPRMHNQETRSCPPPSPAQTTGNGMSQIFNLRDNKSAFALLGIHLVFLQNLKHLL